MWRGGQQARQDQFGANFRPPTTVAPRPTFEAAAVEPALEQALRVIPRNPPRTAPAAPAEANMPLRRNQMKTLGAVARASGQYTTASSPLVGMLGVIMQLGQSARGKGFRTSSVILVDVCPMRVVLKAVGLGFTSSAGSRALGMRTKGGTMQLERGTPHLPSLILRSRRSRKKQ